MVLTRHTAQEQFPYLGNCLIQIISFTQKRCFLSDLKDFSFRKSDMNRKSIPPTKTSCAKWSVFSLCVYKVSHDLEKQSIMPWSVWGMYFYAVGYYFWHQNNSKTKMTVKALLDLLISVLFLVSRFTVFISWLLKMLHYVLECGVRVLPFDSPTMNDYTEVNSVYYTAVSTHNE